MGAPDSVLVLFGTALSVFCEGITPEPTDADYTAEGIRRLAGGEGGISHDQLVYYIRPNEDVMYTRTAGALMKPLSTSEYTSRQRLRDIQI